MVLLNRIIKYPPKIFFRFKIRTKFLISYIFIILLISITIGYATVILSNSIILNNTQELTKQLITQIVESIDYRAEDFEKFSFNFVHDSTSSYNSLKSILNKLKMNTYDHQVDRDLGNIISKYIVSYSNDISSLCIKSPTGDLFYWQKGEAKMSAPNQIDEQNKKRYKRVFEELTLTSNVTVWMNSEPISNDIMFGRRIIDIDTLQYLGDISFTLNSSYFRLVKSKAISIQEANIAILNENNEIITANADTGIKAMTQDVLSQGLINDKYDSVMLEHVGQQYMVTSIQSSNDKWRVMCFVPMTYLLKNTTILKMTVAAIFCISILIALIIAYIIANSTSKNINLLEKSMRKIEEGDFSVKIRPVSYDEIGLLGLRFNYMANKINELINTVYKERIAKQEAEFQTLQAQINPHFLYNTLGTIKWLAKMKDQQEISKMVDALIELMKAAIDKKGNFITILEEIEYVKNYLLLQKIKYEDCFHVTYEIEESIKQCYCLKLTLQPLVENAIFHGLDMSEGNGVIIITATSCNGAIILGVEDNGIGMDKEKIDQILNKSNKKTYPGLSSIGIRNVNQRIKLFYGDNFGLTYHSKLGKGTKVEVRLPIVDHLEEASFYD